ncbi:hypothetical protein VOLCADRAFT_107418 [Volvox carteri f. nagariensis]|uniref:Exportin-1/Importin-beta-like domain-containing protein n=1 Tax=Volvox carteri f. nagariensis TaxID=3068 RepID=D8UDX1_VOLCA|nr:uncharacterized protein VOLCADRAFT_107418 [Volvox carteri f. nagariensis]EFJ42166.1 hypothetical protein VOLCADRAFT_107418 [Volvox carteri f. nagariensis]|eukprot:XP_002956863.1 hypothetical protein VOLCADRAFT_107418 [Volvox carteri f. nagariensis]
MAEVMNQFREQQATDLLESIWGQCRIAMLAQLVAEATAALTGWTGVVGPGGGGGGGGGGSGGGADWRGVEAALFCLRAVHVPVKAAALGGRAGELDNPQAAATAAELQALLGRLFSDICSPSGAVAGLLHVPWVCLAVCRLIAEYAAWLGKGKDAPLLAAMDLLIRALAVPQAAAAAAQAFRNCCVRGAERLTGDPPALSALAAAAMTAVAPPPPPAGGGAGAAAASSSSAAVSLGLDERCAVVEGLSRLASSLPSDAAAAAGCGLMAPCAARAQAVVAAAAAAGGPLSPTTLAALAAELGLMTAVVRYLEPPGPPPRAHVGGLPVPGTSGPVAAAAGAAGGPLDHPALRALQVAWPVLSAVAGEPQCQTDPGVVEALAELYKIAALEGCVQMMAALMNHMQTSSSGPAPSPSFPSCSSPGELAASFFTLVDRYLIFARELLLGGEGVAALPALMDWACRILVTMREREPAAAALSFLGHLLSAAVQVATEEMTGAGSDGAGRPAAAAAAELRSRLDSLFGRYGPRLVQTLLTAGVDTCPLQLARALAGCLAGLTALADAGAAVAELVHSGKLGDGGSLAALFTELLLRGHYPQDAATTTTTTTDQQQNQQNQQQQLLPPLTRGRLDSLVSDFFKLAREGMEYVLSLESVRSTYMPICLHHRMAGSSKILWTEIKACDRVGYIGWYVVTCPRWLSDLHGSRTCKCMGAKDLQLLTYGGGPRPLCPPSDPSPLSLGNPRRTTSAAANQTTRLHLLWCVLVLNGKEPLGPGRRWNSGDTMGSRQSALPSYLSNCLV